jgi:hypothetical protein
MYCIYNSCINVFKKSGSIIYIDISKMQRQLFAIIALIFMMMTETLQADIARSKTVVGNILFEQSTVYIMAILMLIIAVVM